MKFVLYKHSGNPEEKFLLYVTGIYNSEPQFSRYSSDARRYSLLNAIFLSLRFGLTWINEKYIHKTK